MLLTILAILTFLSPTASYACNFDLAHECGKKLTSSEAELCVEIGIRALQGTSHGGDAAADCEATIYHHQYASKCKEVMAALLLSQSSSCRNDRDMEISLIHKNCIFNGAGKYATIRFKNTARSRAAACAHLADATNEKRLTPDGFVIEGRCYDISGYISREPAERRTTVIRLCQDIISQEMSR